MFSINLLKLSAITVGVLPVVLILYERIKCKLWYQAIEKSDEKRKAEEEYLYECVFITHRNFNCKWHVYKTNPCGEDCSAMYLKKLVDVLNSGKCSISMCVYHVTLEAICEALIAAHNRNVLVRVITDREMSFNRGSKINELQNAGIKIAMQTEHDLTGLMHHKYCLIDEKTNLPQMWFGSLNLTMQGLCTNFDNFVITDDKHVISGYSKGFENLWETLLL